MKTGGFSLSLRVYLLTIASEISHMYGLVRLDPEHRGGGRSMRTDETPER